MNYVLIKNNMLHCVLPRCNAINPFHIDCDKRPTTCFYWLLGVYICFVALISPANCEISFIKNCDAHCCVLNKNYAMSRNIFTFTVNKNRTVTENLSRCSCLGHSIEVISQKKKGLPAYHFY